MVTERFVLKDVNEKCYPVSSIGNAFERAIKNANPEDDYVGTILEENTPGFKYDIFKSSSTVSEAESSYRSYMGYV